MDPEDEESMMLLLFITTSIWFLNKKIGKRNRAPRRYAVRPLNRARRHLGHFANLVHFMKQNDHEQFFKYTRMTPKLYDHLLELVGPHLERKRTIYTLSSSQRLIMTLHYLSEGCSMQQIAWDYYVGKTTVHKIIKETCEVLWKTLMPLYLPSVTKAQLEESMEGFYKRWNMPNCFGALDGKHVSIQAPAYSGTSYFSYKKSFSLVLMAMCDSFYRFTFVDIGGIGSQHDSKTFKDTIFGREILGKNSNRLIPSPRPLPGQENQFPCFLVADQAFPLNEHLMRPYPGENLPRKKRIFNYRLSRARRCIENAFGILVQRWRCMRKPIIANIDTCELIVQACVVLHNFLQKEEQDLEISLRRYCPTGFADYVDDNGNFHYGQWRNNDVVLRPVNRMGSNNASRVYRALRDELADYFDSQYGEVSWQNDIVEEGAVPLEFIRTFTL